MANRIKGITVEIGGDTTKLQTALKGVNSEIKNTQLQLRDVEKLLKLDPGNTELLSQKQKLLSQAVAETKEKLETLKTAAEQANTALANGEISQEQYDALQREIIETENELKRLEQQANQSATALQKIAASGEKLKTVGDNISSAGKKLLPVTAAVTGLGTAAVTTAASFESAMSQVQATMGITKDAMSEVDGQSVNTMDTLSALAKKMGAETAFSASECAEALNYLALAGYDTQQMCNTLPTVLNLAAAGGFDLATASDMVTDAMSALGMETSEADTMVDQMAKTASSTNTSVEQLGEGILKIGATAKSIKGGTAELNTALGILANNGIKGAEGGTHLRNVILSLQSPTDKAAALMEELGVQTYDSEGNMRSLNDILGDLNTSMDGLTSAEKDNIISSIFNKTDLAAVNALLANTGETWDDLQQAITESGGAAQQMADTQLDNLEGQITILKSALEGLAISIGELLLPAIKIIVGWIQNFVDWLNGLDDGTKKVVVTAALLAAALGPVLIVVGKVISAVGTIMTVLPKLSAAFTAVKAAFAGLSAVLAANPIFLIVAAVAAAAAAVVLLYNKCEWFRDAVNAVWLAVKNFFVDVWQGICSFFTETIPNAWNSLVSFFAGIPAWWSGLWQGISDFFSDTWTDMMNNPVLSAITTTIQNLWQNLTETLQGIWSGLVQIAAGARELLKNTVLAPVLLLIDLVTGNFTQLASDAQNIWNNMKQAASDIWMGIQQVVGSLVQGIVAHVVTLVSGLHSTVSAIWTSMKQFASDAWNTLKSTVVSIAGNIKENAVTAFKNLVSGIRSALSNLGSVVSNGFQSAISFITSLPGKALQWGRDFIMGIVNGIRSCISAVTDAVESVAEKIRSVLHFSVPDEGPLTDYESWMPDFMKGLAKGIEKSKYLVADAMNGVASDMVLSPQTGKMEYASAGGVAYTAESLAGITSAITAALAGFSGQGGDIVIPVYLGGTLLDEVIVDAQQRANLRSGGR